MAARLGLFDLLAPQYLVGIQLPQQVHNYLSILGIDEFESFYTDKFVVYTGTASFEGDGSGSADIVHEEPSGARFTWERKNLHFRMMIPRDGAGFVDTAVNSATDGKLAATAALLNDLRPDGSPDMDDAAHPVVTDYPAVAFRLELLVDILNFSLGEDWKPGIINPSDNRVKIDPANADKRVLISLPKVLISYTQSDNAADLNPQFKIESWGTAGFDAPQDLAMGELIHMTPALAVHKSEHVAFSIDQVIIDASKDATPPEIMEHFGIDEEWEGIFIGQALIYYSNDQGVGFNFRIKDALISFAGEVSLEAALDIYLNSTLGTLTADPAFYNGAQAVNSLIRGIIDPPVNTIPSTDPEGSITIQQNATMQLQVHGGMPPYNIRVMQDGTNIWNSTTRQATFSTTGTHNVFINVTDSSTGAGGALSSSEYLRVTVQAAAATTAPPDGAGADRPAGTDPLQALDPYNITRSGSATASHDLIITENGSTLTLEVRGPEPFTLNTTGPNPQTYTNQRTVQVDVPNNTHYDVALNFPAIPANDLSPVYEIHFNYNKPANDTALSDYTGANPSDGLFRSSWASFAANAPAAGTFSAIRLEGYASLETYSNGTSSSPGRDQELSRLRNAAVAGKLSQLYPSVTPTSQAHGHDTSPYSSEPFDRNNANYTNDENRLVRMTFTRSAAAAVDITATLNRPAAPAGGGGTTPVPAPGTAPNPPALPNDIPPVLKQLGIRVKIERNKLDLLELYGKVDFETELETKLKNEERTPPPAGHDPSPHTPDDSEHLGLQNTNTADGIVDFKFTYQYDQATNETTLIFKLHSDDNDTDGLLHMDNTNRTNTLQNIFGALLVFAPIINASATAVGNDPDSPGAWIGLGASLFIPVFIGGAGYMLTRKVILYGGEARTRFVTPAPGEPLRSLDVGLVFDYEVQFDIVCEALGIGINRKPGAPGPLPPPLRARYKAIGFNLNYSDTPAYKGLTYTPVFDASRGYDLDLSDPSLFQLPAPLGDLFNIAGARLARFNPLTLEVDFAIKVDLGIITVDKFKLKIPIDPPGAPQIIPSGVRVNIPGVLTGNGFVEIIDADIPDDSGNTVHAKGVEGGLDLTLVSLKIRIAANVGLGTLKDNTTGREAVSVFIGMTVQFPTPIILGATGLGIYGFMGLFAMHYKRLEDPADPTKAVGPALNWLIKADGDPTKLKNTAGTRLWGMALDKWSFGIGVLMGTAEGGFLVNMQGMLVLELPGPRILIMVKVQIVSVLPSQPADPATKLQVGIIGIVDIDFGRQQLTLGVMLNFSIEQVLAITLPIELFFKWNDPSNWHLYLGTIAQPCSATILDIVRGSAYLMIQGNELVYANYGSNVPAFLQDKRLNGIAIAIGLEASIVLGDEGSGIYLKIAAGAHLGVSFSPFLVVGTMYFTGKLRLLIISIGANGSFDVLVTKRKNSDDLKVYMHGEICGSIDLFFFEISACIGITIGDDDFDVVAPKLVRGVYLQSFSPVLVSGQGSTKPIDASLGTAFDVSTGSIPSDLITVPIDSLPVIQLQAAPGLSGTFDLNSFIQSPGDVSGTAGELMLSDEVKVVYTLNSVTLTENGAPYNSGYAYKAPSVWRIDRPKNGSVTDTAIDLATFSRTPATAPFAVERSTELQTSVKVRWENACKKAAPPSSVLFTFCGQHLGFSNSGWNLNGTTKPDPDGTVRVSPVNTYMRVYQPGAFEQFSTMNMLLGNLGFETCNAARVVGIDNINVKFPETRQQKCFDLTAKKSSYQSNPLIVEKELEIFSAEDKKSFYSKSKGFLQHSALKPFESPYRTHFRSISKTIALSLREYMRVDVLKEAVNEISVSFTCFNTKAKDKPRVIITAYDDKGKIVAEKLFVDTSRKEEVHTITLSGEGIKHLIIYNRNFTGHITKICFVRVSKPNLQNIENYLRCFRSLQLPYCSRSRPDQRKLERLNKYLNSDELKKYLSEKEDCAQTIFETGACENILFYGALHLKSPKKVIVAELDDHNNVLKEYILDDLIVKDIAAPATDLPADWLNAALPWRPSVVSVATYLQSGFFNAYRRILFQLKPSSEKATKVRFTTCVPDFGPPVLYISAIEALQLSEVQHNANVTEMQTTEQHTIENYLNDNSPIPLLKPNSEYRISVNYTAAIYTRKKKTDSFTLKYSPADTVTQTFAFRTDAKPPVPLSPYVLGTTPNMDEQFHFFKDPLMVVFNDPAFLKMFQAYGKQLKAVIRGANGQPVGNSPADMITTTEIPAQVKSPYREAVEALIEAGVLGCFGEINIPGHPAYQPLFDLKPLMPYTFDIDFDPKDPSDPAKAEQPLYRRAFKTSRYADLEDFAKDLSAQLLKHKALKTTLTLPAGADPVVTLSDVEFEQLLSSGGMVQSDAKEKTGFTLLWSNNSGDFTPYGLLIDASEPMWRSRTELSTVAVLNEQHQVIDPNFVIYEPAETDAMLLKGKTGQNLIRQFIRSSGGTRTLALFNAVSWPDAGTTLSVQIVQTASVFYALPGKEITLVELLIGPKAPWED